MKLKIAQISDIIELQKICTDAYAQNFSDHWYEGGLALYLQKEFNSKRLKSDLADQNTGYYFIEYQQSVVGFIKIRYNPHPDIPIENSAELEKIYVLPGYKGKGIGKLALYEIIKKVEGCGKSNLFLCVIDSNESAIAFYKKLGFEFHSKTTLDVPYFKEELKGMHRMVKELIGNNNN